MNFPSTISPPNGTSTGGPLDDSVCHADFFHAHRSSHSSIKQSVHPQRRQVSFCQYHSEPDLLSRASPPPFDHSFSSATEVQCQTQRRGPSHGATRFLPCHGPATFSVDRKLSISHSTTGPSWNCRRSEPSHKVTSATHTATRVLPPVTAGDQDLSPVMRYPPTFYHLFSDATSDAQAGPYGSVMGSVTAQEAFENEMCECPANGTEDREHSRQMRVGKSCKGDANANAVLMFTGLFTPIVVSFIMEAYKMLSSDSGDKKSPPTCQVTKELAGSASGTLIPLQACSPPPPPASIVCVNVMLLISLVLCIASALFATLNQQWARKHNRFSQIAMTVTVTLLHLSVSLFLAGLVIFFFIVYKTVAIFVSITVGLFVVVYFALTMLACVDRNVLYRTPLSRMWWARRERRDYP